MSKTELNFARKGKGKLSPAPIEAKIVRNAAFLDSNCLWPKALAVRLVGFLAAFQKTLDGLERVPLIVGGEVGLGRPGAWIVHGQLWASVG